MKHQKWIMELHFAPMQGYVDHVYRRVHNEVYGGVDAYYTPFIRIESGEPRRQDITRLQRSVDDGVNTVPQIIFGSFDEFTSLVDALKSSGHHRIDLNLGCPYPMQTNRGRGAAMITNREVMEQVAKAVADDTDTEYSVKMRIGDQTPDDWQALMPILNTMPLRHVTLHPRISRQKYDGEIYTDSASAFIAESRNPVIYNGDIRTAEDIDDVIARYPSIKGVMIGRGLLARPSLAEEWRSGSQWTREQQLDGLRRLHDGIYQTYQTELCGPTQILQKIKPFWEYLDGVIDRKALKQIRKANTLPKYGDAAIAALS